MKVLSADKIEILSHQDLHLRSTNDELKQGINGHWRRIVDSNGYLNDCIIIEKVELGRSGVDSLAKILSVKNNSGISQFGAMCFFPHEAIIIYSKGKCSFIDICFGCLRYSSSGDIIFPSEFLSTDEQWYQLKRFFIAKGIKYKIELKPD